jgi:hypothetical protein
MHAGGFGGFRGGAIHSGFGGSRGSFAAMPANRFAGVRGFNSFRHGSGGWNRGWGGGHFVGGYGGGGYPYYDDGFDVGLGLVGVGLGLATAGYAYCSPYDYGYYGYCGPSSVVGW